MRNIFGWDLPPGCSMRDIDEQCSPYVQCGDCGEMFDCEEDEGCCEIRCSCCNEKYKQIREEE